MQQRIRTFSEAVQLLKNGSLLVYPTETFFAVGCNMWNVEALANIYTAKQRPQKRPLPLLCAHMQQVESISHLQDMEKKLVQDFWPGPLTLLCKAKNTVSELITAGTGKVAVRISPHPIARALAEVAPLVCSSANISGEEPTTEYTLLSAKMLANVQGLLIDGPKPQGGLASTIVEVLENNTLHVRRQGALPIQDLQAKGWHVIT